MTQRFLMTRWTKLTLLAATLAAAGYAYWKLAIPKHRVAVRSELVMLGDLDGDHRWTAADLKILKGWRADPYAADARSAWKLDLNRNGLVDAEDLRLLEVLVAAGGDPYSAEEAARASDQPFPRPRELYRFVQRSTTRRSGSTRPIAGGPMGCFRRSGPTSRRSSPGWKDCVGPTSGTSSSSRSSS
jgi:hypothetical protein